MDPLDERAVRQDETLIRDLLVSTAQAIIIDELIGEEHDICVHAILLCELNHCVRVSIREPTKQRYV